jgi:hypothetical protein
MPSLAIGATFALLIIIVVVIVYTFTKAKNLLTGTEPFLLPLRYVAINSKGIVMVIDSVNDTYWANKNALLWKKFDKSFEYASINDNNNIVGILKGTTEIWAAKDLMSPVWVKLPGGLKSVNINNNGNICGLSGPGHAWYGLDYNALGWKSMIPVFGEQIAKFGKGVRVVVNDDSIMFFLNDKGDIYWKDLRHNDLPVLLQTSIFVDIFVEGHKLCGKDAVGDISCADNYLAPEWVKMGNFKGFALSGSDHCEFNDSELIC